MFSGWRGFASRSAPESSDTPHFDESFRILRANLSVALADLTRPSVVITSAEAGEGKTTACCHLASAFAAAGQRVILVDLDLRHPDAHRLLGTHNEFGASDVLLGQRSLQESLQYLEPGIAFGTESAGLYFLAAGGAVVNPADVLAGGRTARLLESLAAQADIVLLDTPPVLPVADTLVIGRIASGAVLVTEGGRTGLESVEKAKGLLVRNHTRLFGVMINKFSGRDEVYQQVGSVSPGAPAGGAGGGRYGSGTAAGNGSM